MEDVIAGKFLGGRRGKHFLPANDTDIVGGCKFLLSGVWIIGVHVVNGPTRLDHVIKGLLE